MTTISKAHYVNVLDADSNSTLYLKKCFSKNGPFLEYKKKHFVAAKRDPVFLFTRLFNYLFELKYKFGSEPINFFP